jgi:ABC-type phosphate/phosphonate transport system permease subunit
VVYAGSVLDMTWARFVAGFGHGARFISRMFPPNFAHDKLELLYSGMLESLQIAIIATVAGVLLSLPLGLMAARNLSPLPLAWAARAIIALFRTFHPVIIAILFVKAVGFGALAGMLADRRLARIPFRSWPRPSRKCPCRRWRRCGRPALPSCRW